MTRYQIASDRYLAAYRATRAMAAAPAVQMGPPQDFKVFRLYAAYPAHSKEEIARSASRCRRLFKIMHRYAPVRIAA